MSANEAANLERELARELPPGHALVGRCARALCRSDDSDTVAFLIDGNEICVVHLTCNVQTDPNWPWCRFVTTLPESGDEDEQ